MKKAIAILLVLAAIITSGGGVNVFSDAGDEYVDDVTELLPIRY
ncbi:hypothetical protein [Candidatus Xianfuyuplasma coldseepsis]|nr:hypothetical protein [Xianfuyuplasma coldseepsis]